MLLNDPPRTDNVQRVLGDFVYSWDRFTKLLTKRHKNDRRKTMIAVLEEPSSIDKIIYDDYH